MLNEPENSVSEVTRRNIFDALSVENFEWSGRLTETRFLGRLFDLNSLPSYDPRHTTAAQDITRHREWNDDWSLDWVFHDRRFDLLRCPDEMFLKFLCEMAHPVVQPDAGKVSWLIELFNRYLSADGRTLVKGDELSGRPTFAAQRLNRITLGARPMAKPEGRQAVDQAGPALSRKTITEFREFVATWTLREIRDLFNDEGIPLAEDYVSPLSGQRRSLADSYLNGIDLSEPLDVSKLIKAIEHVLIKLSAEIEDQAETSAAADAERSQRNLLRWLRRDGFDFQNGRLSTTEAKNSSVPSQVMPKREAVTEPALPASSQAAPTAFVSYSWDDEEHKEWVLEFARRLRREGVDAKLDRWDVSLGDPLPQFMETAIRTNDFVLTILTPAYREKSDGRKGGVGYEGNIMTAELFAGKDQRKFIPILRRGSWESASPSWLQGKLGVDLQGNPYSEKEFSRLKDTLHKTQEKAPPLGPAPSLARVAETTQPMRDGTRAIPRDLPKPTPWGDFTSCEHDGIKWTWRWSAEADHSSLEYIERLESWCPACGKRIEPSDDSESTVEKIGARDLYGMGKRYGGYNISTPLPFTLYRCDNGCTKLKFPGYRNDREASVKREIEHRAMVRTDAESRNAFEALSVEVRSFYYQDVNEPEDSLPVITSCPRRYRAELGLTNQTGHAVYIKSVTLRVGGDGTYKRDDESEITRIEAREYKTLDETFPVNDHSAPRNGEFEVEVTPAVGNPIKVKGRFPM